MSNHQRFRLSHLMPNSWFYKLRDMKRPRPTNQRNTETARTSTRSSSDYYHGTTTPKPVPLSPHRSYPYLNTKRISLEKLQPSALHIKPKASDIQFPKDQHHHHHHHQLSTSRTSAVIIEGNHDEFQELQLHPIRTRPAPTGSAMVHSESGTCPSSPRMRSRRLHVLSGCRVSTATASRRRSTAGRSLAIVMKSTDPSRDFRESMLEMIVENNLCAQEDFQDLLECYLSLNSPVYHGVIMEVFRGILLDIMFDNVEV